MTIVERRRERAMALGVGTDVLTAAPMLGIAIWSHSLTLLADALRGGLLTLLELFAYIMLRRIHRRRLPSYEYGSGKIESLLNLLIGAALVVSGIWVFGLGVISLLHPPPARPLGLAGATMIAAVNAVQNAWMFLTVLRAGRDRGSVLINGQVRTRLLKLISSIIATLAILISAIFAGHISGVFADLVGSAVVFQVMIWTAYKLIASSLPDLLDRALDEPQRAAINGVLIRHVEVFDLILHVRTRKSGITKFVEIGLGFDAERRMGDVDLVSQAVRREVEAVIPGANVIVVATALSAFAPARSDTFGCGASCSSSFQNTEYDGCRAHSEGAVQRRERVVTCEIESKGNSGVGRDRDNIVSATGSTSNFCVTTDDDSNNCRPVAPALAHVAASRYRGCPSEECAIETE